MPNQKKNPGRSSLANYSIPVMALLDTQASEQRKKAHYVVLHPLHREACKNYSELSKLGKEDLGMKHMNETTRFLGKLYDWQMIRYGGIII